MKNLLRQTSPRMKTSSSWGKGKMLTVLCFVSTLQWSVWRDAPFSSAWASHILSFLNKLSLPYLKNMIPLYQRSHEDFPKFLVKNFKTLGMKYLAIKRRKKKSRNCHNFVGIQQTQIQIQVQQPTLRDKAYWRLECLWVKQKRPGYSS